MAKKFPLNPKHPERICWGCDKYCPVDDLACGNGTDRVQHPAELFGDDWYEWGLEPIVPAASASTDGRSEEQVILSALAVRDLPDPPAVRSQERALPLSSITALDRLLL